MWSILDYIPGYLRGEYFLDLSRVKGGLSMQSIAFLPTIYHGYSWEAYISVVNIFHRNSPVEPLISSVTPIRIQLRPWIVIIRRHLRPCIIIIRRHLQPLHLLLLLHASFPQGLWLSVRPPIGPARSIGRSPCIPLPPSIAYKREPCKYSQN